MDDGARLVLARPGGHRDSAYLHDLIRREGVSTLHFVPSMLDIFLEHREPAGKHAIRQVFCSGEVLTPELVRRFSEQYCCPLHNLYGPTEAAIDVTWWPCGKPDDSRRVPLGYPIANIEAHVLDRDLRLVPDDVRGELFLGGVGLARGYLHRPDLTAERFVPHPFGAPGERLYRTGDIVWRRPDGALEYFGRNDGQVKLRGQRIELGEIESALRRCEGVRQAVVRVETGRAGQQELVAYVGGPRLEAMALREQLRRTLPSYMVPARLQLQERLPVNSNGKLDMRALTRLQPGEHAPTRQAPQGETEQTIAKLWQEVLHTPEPGREDDFREAGGNSLLAIRLLSRLRAAFEQDLPLSLLFEQPTIVGLAAAITATRTAHFTVLRRRSNTEAPLSFAQQRLWFLAQWAGGSQAYNLPLLFQVQGTVNRERIQAALQVLCDRHEALHSRIVVRDGTPAMVPDPRCTVDLQFQDASADEERVLRTWVERPFDLLRAPLLRCCLLRRSDTEHLLLLVFHHIAVDGWSLQVLLQEFQQLYEGEALAPLALDYGDYATWEQQRAANGELREAEQFWQTQLATDEALLALPTDNLTDPLPAGGASQGFTLTAGALQAVRELRRDLRLNEATIVAAAFGLLLGRWSERARFLIGLPVAQREVPGTERMVGLLLNTLPLRIDLGCATIAELLRGQGAAVRDVLSHGNVPLERIVNVLRPGRDAAGHSLFRVLLVTQFGQDADLQTTGARWTPLPLPSHTSKFDLTLSINLNSDRAECAWEYRADLFRPETIALLAESFDQLLRRFRSDLHTPLSALAIAVPATRPGKQSQSPGENNPYPESSDTSEANDSELEARLTTIWADVLHTPHIGRHDNFFALGGDSLLTMRVSHRAAVQGIAMEVSDLFQAQTIAMLARRVSRTTAAPPPTHTALESERALPLSPSQAFFFRTVGHDPHHYNLERLAATHVRLPEDGWQRIAAALVERHDALRLHFPGEGTSRHAVVQPFHPDRHRNLLHVDLTDATDAEASEAIEQQLAALQQSFDLARGGLLRLAWFDLGGHRPGRLLLLAHHLVADGISMGLLWQDLETLVAQALAGQQLSLPRPRTGWAAWVRQLHTFSQTPLLQAEVRPWLLSRPGTPLPLDESMVEGISNLQRSEEEVTITVPRPGRRIPERLMAALHATLREWLGTEQYQYDFITNGRFPFSSAVDVSQTSGYFSTRLPVLGAWATDPGFWLRSNPLSYGAGRFLAESRGLTDALHPFERSSLSLNYLGETAPQTTVSQLFWPAAESAGASRSGRQRRACALHLFAHSSEEALHLSWKFSTDLHRRATVEHWAGRMATALRRD